MNTSLSGDKGGASLVPGDVVEVCEGELVHLQGKVMKMEGGIVTVMPEHEDLNVSWSCVDVLKLWWISCDCVCTYICTVCHLHLHAYVYCTYVLYISKYLRTYICMYMHVHNTHVQARMYMHVIHCDKTY